MCFYGECKEPTAPSELAQRLKRYDEEDISLGVQFDCKVHILPSLIKGKEADSTAFDPYVVVKFKDMVDRTFINWNTMLPDFSREISLRQSINIRENSKVDVAVWDRNENEKDLLLGAIVLDLRNVLAAGLNGSAIKYKVFNDESYLNIRTNCKYSQSIYPAALPPKPEYNCTVHIKDGSFENEEFAPQNPYVLLKNAGETCRTKTQFKNKSPLFDEKFTLPVIKDIKDTNSVEISILNEHEGRDTLFGAVSFNIRDWMDFELNGTTIDFTFGKNGKLNVQTTCHEIVKDEHADETPSNGVNEPENIDEVDEEGPADLSEPGQDQLKKLAQSKDASSSQMYSQIYSKLYSELYTQLYSQLYAQLYSTLVSRPSPVLTSV